jgi:hypothetical protein
MGFDMPLEIGGEQPQRLLEPEPLSRAMRVVVRSTDVAVDVEAEEAADVVVDAGGEMGAHPTGSASQSKLTKSCQLQL